jgi:hypothetical protein
VRSTCIQSGGERFTRLYSVRLWDHQIWTRLYEAALFERDPVKLCARLWAAQLAILTRKREIESMPRADKEEIVALKRALGILTDLGQLSGFQDPIDRPIAFARKCPPTFAPLDARARSTRRRTRSLRVYSPPAAG